MRSLDSAVVQELRQRVSLQKDPARIERVDIQGKTYWIKRPEHHSFLWRLRKGDPLKALRREILGYRQLNALGLAAAPLVDSGADYFITANGGASIATLYHDQLDAPEERGRALRAAAKALHDIHAAGMAHGRPNLKDMLWDGEKVHFIDFEMFGVIKNQRRAQILDLLIFGLSCFAIANSSATQTREAILTYRALDQRGIWQGAIRWLRRLQPARRAMQPLLKSGKRLRDLRAFCAMIDLLTALDAEVAGAA
ncbi:lipopolysaccharide kinase InaA family protein [Rhizobium helianthi]|uniref:Lipopolysaccharide kinase InaA family protein n=1 Tax=Rhizobium helianthi TaxID=1132695 RepID=A0ABW4M9X8_9HYPH